MSVPPVRDVAPEWVRLTPEGKRARVLSVAGELFAREGIDVPMPELARAVGVGVGSLYRQFAKKDDVIAALVLQRAAKLEARFEQAAERADAGAALREVILETVDEALVDRIAQESWSLIVGRPEVDAARARVGAKARCLFERAREQGALRPDARADDVALLFSCVRAAERGNPGGARRLTTLVLSALIARD